MPDREEQGQGRAVAVVGCGGVGTWSAITLGMVDGGQPGVVAKVGLFDGDKLEDKNFARVPLTMYRRGTLKVDAVRAFMVDYLKFRKPVVLNHGMVTKENISPLLGEFDTVICATDDVENQRLVQMWCQQNGKEYQRAGYDGDTINVCRGFPLTFDEVEEKADAGYHEVPEVYHAMLAGTLAVYSVLRNEVSVMGEVANLGIIGGTGVPEGVRAGIVAEGWMVEAMRRRWHAQDACSVRDVLRRVSATNLMEEVILSTGLEFVTQLMAGNPDDVVDRLENVHRRGHRTARSWCPWCTNQSQQTLTEELRGERDRLVAEVMGLKKAAAKQRVSGGERRA